MNINKGLNSSYTYRNFVACTEKGAKRSVEFKYPEKPVTLSSRLRTLFKKDNTIKLISDEENNATKKRFNFDFHIKDGDTFGVADRLYINNGGKLELLNMTPDKYRELFVSPSNKFAVQSKRLGDCWLVSTINGLMGKPKGKKSILYKFGQDCNDMYIKLKKREIIFPQSDVLYSSRGKNLKGAKGLQMLEEAVALSRQHFVVQDAKSAADTISIDSVLNELNAGVQLEALHYLAPQLKPKIINATQKRLQKKIIVNQSNKSDIFLGLMTHENTNNLGGKFGGVLRQKHCFMVTGFDKTKQNVILQDPFSPDKPINIALDELMQYPFSLTYAKF